MDGRIAIVTGGTRGIGAAISERLAARGYRVGAVYHGNDAAAKAFEQKSGIRTFKWDVAAFGECEAGVETVRRLLGGPADILVNNAGITCDAMLHKMTSDQWDRVIATDLTGVFNMSRAVIGSMRERLFGRIVNISSINGQKGQLGQSNYAAAKAGLLGFTRALALESAGKGITVNAIAPGYVETDMVAAVPPDVLGKIVSQIPVGRLGQPDEIARIVEFLASDESSFITGATMSANGGQYMAA